jgi:O-antigen ligase
VRVLLREAQSTSAVAAVDSPTSLSLKDIFPSFGVFCLLLFCFVIVSDKLPLGEAAAIGALLAMFSAKRGLALPPNYLAYLGYVTIGVLGLSTSQYKVQVYLELKELVKVAAIGLAACTILNDRRAVRGFTFGYLALYALFPIRGSLYNYIMGIAPGGRFAWNFIFENPNDLAMLTILPLGMSGYFLVTERKGIWRYAALAGLVVTTMVMMLTQSRGALLGLGAGVFYFFALTKKRGQAMVLSSLGLVIAAAFAPSSLWDRLGGLANISVASGMKGVDKESSAESRWQIMGVGIQIAKENPVIGVGIGAYPTEHFLHTMHGEAIPSASGARDAHSTYIRSAAETGVLGLACIVGFIFLSWREVARTRAALPEAHAPQRKGLLALEVSLVAFAVAILFGSTERLTFFVLQMLIPYCTARVIRRELLGDRPLSSLRSAG